jgi:hypothetical protein
VKIPLQDMLLGLRRHKQATAAESAAWRAWASLWSSPASYRASVRLASTAARMAPWLPGWSSGRELPRPSGGSFRRRFERGDL